MVDQIRAVQIPRPLSPTDDFGKHISPPSAELHARPEVASSAQSCVQIKNQKITSIRVPTTLVAFITMSQQSYALFCMGNPLLDIQVTNGEQLLKKYNLNANDAILADEKHLPMWDIFSPHSTVF